jgi:hypothetical protein
MESKERLIRNLKKHRKKEFFSRLVKIIFLSVFIILTPIIIYEKIQEKDFMTVVLLSISELIISVIAIILLKIAIKFYQIKNSGIFRCIENPQAVSEIVVTPCKIVFEIKGMEDETIFLKHSVFRTEILTTFKEVFGENKFVNNS